MDETTHGDRPFIPAMGQHRFLPGYDLVARLAGVTAAHRSLIDRASVADGQDVLEIGCGTGNLLLRVKRKNPRATVTGIDPDSAALAGAKRKSVRRGLDVGLDQGYADDLPYPDASQDRVLSALMYHHLPDDQKGPALREAWRVLRPGGQLHLLDLVADDGHHHGRMAERTSGNSIETITSAMREAGFSDAAYTGATRLRLGRGRCLTFRGTR